MPSGRVRAGDEFEMLATFSDAGDNCACRCCEYRQYVRGSFKINGKTVKHKLASGYMSPGTYREDTADLGGGRILRYGHRRPDSNRPGDEYRPFRDNGCEYLGWDFPSVTAAPGTTFEIDLHFKAEIKDSCTGQIVTTRFWTVHYSGTL